MEEPTESNDWDVESYGMSQLRELNAMERTQDSAYWVSVSILVVANAFLVAEFFGQEEHFLARLALSILGLAIAAVMVLMVDRSLQYKKRWLDKAKALEMELGIPPVYAVWDQTGLPGFGASHALMLAMYGLAIMWAAFVSFAAVNLVF